MAINNDADSSLSPEEQEERMRTLWVGNLDEKCEEEVLYELFMNAGPLEKVHQPADKVTKKKKNFAFILYEHQESIKYAYDLLNGVQLYGQPLKLQHKQTGLGFFTRQPLQRGDRGMGGGHARSYSTSDLGRNGGYNNFRGGGGQQPTHNNWGRDNSRGYNHNFQNQPPFPPGEDYGTNPPLPPGVDHNPPLPPLPPPPMEDPRYGGGHQAAYNNQYNNHHASGGYNNQYQDQSMYSRGQPYADYNNSYQQRSRDRGYDQHDRRDRGGGHDDRNSRGGHDDRNSRGHRDDGRNNRDRSSHGSSSHGSSSHGSSSHGSSSHGHNHSSSYRRKR